MQVLTTTRSWRPLYTKKNQLASPNIYHLENYQKYAQYVGVI